MGRGWTPETSNQKVTVSIGTMGSSAPDGGLIVCGEGSAGSRIAGKIIQLYQPAYRGSSDNGLQRHVQRVWVYQDRGGVRSGAQNAPRGAAPALNQQRTPT